jgi:DNA-binding PadR family transcriptional regulator
MLRTRAPSRQTALVLCALAAEPSAWRHGYDLGQQVGLRSGSLYPILMRLAQRNLLDTAWETDAPHGRPPRHLYRLTPAGLALAAQLDVAANARPVASLRAQPAPGGGAA